MGQVAQNQSIERAFRLLRAVGAGGNPGRRLSEVVAATRLSKSTAHRLLQVLAHHGMIQNEARSGRFFLGYELFALGIGAGNRFGLLEIGQGPMRRLAERTGDTVYLSVPDGTEAVCIARVEGEFPIKTLTLAVGDRRPLGVGAGSLALLAFQPEAEIARIIAANFRHQTRYQGFTPDAVNALVEATRRQGHAYNDGRVVAGMSALGVPVLDTAGNAVAALSVAAITSRMRGARRTNVVAWLQREAKKLEQALHPLGRFAGDTARTR